MRISDGERELLYEQLTRHAAAGRLSVEELERRVELVAGADSREAAATALTDLPSLTPAAPPAPPPTGSRRRGRGHAETDTPAADWQATNERFRDPRSGRVMRVWIDADGGRHYIAE